MNAQTIIFHISLIKDEEELQGQDWTDRRTDGMIDTHTRMNEGNFYSAPLPMSGDKMDK